MYEICKRCGTEFEPDEMGENICGDCLEDENMPREGYYPRNTDIDKR